VASEHGLLTAQALFGTSESRAEIKRAFAAHRVKLIGGFLQDFGKVKALYCEVNLNLLEIGSIILEKEAMIPGLELGRSQLLQKYLESVQATARRILYFISSLCFSRSAVFLCWERHRKLSSMTLTAVEFVPGHCHLGLWTGVNAKDEMRVSLF